MLKMTSEGFYVILGIVVILCLLMWTFMPVKFKKETFCDAQCQEDVKIIAHLKSILRMIAPEIVNYNIQPGIESVTVNKENIFICLRDPKTKKIYPLDILLFVTLHEFAHVLSKTYSTKSHNGEFKNNFNNLLKQAYKKNFLTSNIVIPDDYCQQTGGLEKFLNKHFLLGFM